MPAAIANAPLTDDTGHATSLAAYRGKVVVLTDFLTLCQDVCPLTSANFAQMDRAVAAAHLDGQVPSSSRPPSIPSAIPRAACTPTASCSTLRRTGRCSPPAPRRSPRSGKYFGAWYQKGPEDSPPGIDWWTGKPLTYDVDHEDVMVFLDSAGHERFLINGLPNTQNHLPPAKLGQFLNDLGRTHLNQPTADTLDRPPGAATPLLAHRRDLARPVITGAPVGAEQNQGVIAAAGHEEFGSFNSFRATLPRRARPSYP